MLAEPQPASLRHLGDLAPRRLQCWNATSVQAILGPFIALAGRDSSLLAQRVIIGSILVAIGAVVTVIALDDFVFPARPQAQSSGEISH